MEQMPPESHGGLPRKFLLGIPRTRSVGVKLRLPRGRMKLLQLQDGERLAVDAVKSHEAKVAILHRLAAERTGGVEDVLAPRELGDLTELLLTEVRGVERRPILHAKEVIAHDSANKFRIHNTLLRFIHWFQRTP